MTCVWQHQAIAWTNVDISLVRFCGIHLRAIPQQMPKLQFCRMNLNSLLLIIFATFPRGNELNYKNLHCFFSQKPDEFSMLLALPCGRDHMDVMQQTKTMRAGFIQYLQQKLAAGIVNVAAPGSGSTQVSAFDKINTVETLYNTINFCWSTHKRHSIARPKGRGMGCLLWVQRATYFVDLAILSSIKYLL